jgi:opacity protein-like surface antigen
MKKAFAIMMVAVVTGTSAFALDLSAGIGGLFTADFTSASSKDTAVLPEEELKEFQSTLLGGGFNLFFDAQYAALNIGMAFGSHGYSDPDASDDIKVGGKYAYGTTALRIGLLGKYPIAINDKFTLFPLLGIDYEIILGAKHDGDDLNDTMFKQDSEGNDTDATKELSALWFKLGVGADIALTDKLYLRPEFLYGIRLNNKSETDQLDEDQGGKKYSEYVGILGHGLDVKVSIGYKF